MLTCAIVVTRNDAGLVGFEARSGDCRDRRGCDDDGGGSVPAAIARRIEGAEAA